MKFNENLASSTERVLLVPYDAHHVPRYHAWMEDEAIREATASERLTLDEEYENQQSWRTSVDKLTFIVCKPLDGTAAAVVAGEADAPERMVGDINLFLTPWEEDDDDEGEDEAGAISEPRARDKDEKDKARYCVGEIDIMIADTADRGKGMGKAAVSTFLRFIRENLDGILAEYDGKDQSPSSSSGLRLKMKEFLVRIKATNTGSIALFRGLGFEQRGEVNYFGEIEMVLLDFLSRTTADGGMSNYRETIYDRSKLDNRGLR